MLWNWPNKNNVTGGAGGGAEKNGRGCQKCLTIYGVNGLVANPKKTSLIILNQKVRKDEVIKIKIGNDYVSQEKSAKLLGVTFDSNQGWKTQIYGSGGVVMSLNRRLFAIRRLRSHLDNKNLLKLADGLFTSKIRFGLQ